MKATNKHFTDEMKREFEYQSEKSLSYWPTKDYYWLASDLNSVEDLISVIEPLRDGLDHFSGPDPQYWDVLEYFLMDIPSHYTPEFFKQCWCLIKEIKELHLNNPSLMFRGLKDDGSVLIHSYCLKIDNLENAANEKTEQMNDDRR